MKERAAEYSTVRLADALGVKRSGYYAGLQPSLREQEDELLLVEIRRIYDQHKRRYGSPRITHHLQEQGIRCSRKRVARLMRQAGLEGESPRRKRPRTTDSTHEGRIAPNRLKEAGIEAPNEVWAMDITYVEVDTKWVYLAGVLDLYSRKIVGWQMAEHMRATLVVNALERAISQRGKIPPGLVAHSDRGSQYASDEYQAVLKRYGMIQSMSAKGNCYDNATMESFFGTLKREELDRYKFHSYAEARDTVFEYIETYYNTQRIHTGLGGLTPEKYEALAAPRTPKTAPTAQGVSEASEAPVGRTKKAGNTGSRPRPSVARTCYPSEGCSPAEPSSVSQGEASQTEESDKNKQKNEQKANISPSCV